MASSESGLRLLAPFILAARSSARKEVPHPLPIVSAKISLGDNDFILESNAEVMIHLGVMSLKLDVVSALPKAAEARIPVPKKNGINAQEKKMFWKMNTNDSVERIMPVLKLKLFEF